MSSSFYPTAVGRVTSQQSISRLLFQIHTDGGAIQSLQTQLSTGRRIDRPSDDPAAAIRALAAQRSLEFKGQAINNLKSANTVLSATESTLSNAQSILNEIRGLAIESSSNILSDEERSANSSQINGAIRKLVELGNTRFRDQYLFAGSDVLDAPLKLVGNSVRFSGTEARLNTLSDIGSTLAANVTADEAFGTRSDHVIGTTDLNPALELTTPVADLNAGSGVRLGSIAFSDGADRIEVDVSKAHSVQDIVDAIGSKQLSGRNLTVTVTPTGLTLDYLDGLGGIMRIEEVGAGLTAADLGIRTVANSSNVPIVGSDLNPITTTSTRISQLFGGAGIANGSVFKIRQNNYDYLVNTSGMQTIEDLVNGIQASGARVRAGLDSSGKHFIIQSTESGTTLFIGEDGGTLASQLGVRTLDLSTPVAQLNFGQGIFSSQENLDLRIKRTDGSELKVELDGVQTVGDVLTRINSHVDNFVPALRVVASLASVGNGIRLSALSGAQPLELLSVGGSQAAIGLGLIPIGGTVATGVTSGVNSVINGADVSGIEVEGTFTTLIRLEEAVRDGDTQSMERLVQALDNDIGRLSTSRSIVGSRQQDIGDLQTRTEDQQTQLKEVESTEIDADLASVISELSARQAALQASLQLMSRASKLSLFDYL